MSKKTAILGASTNPSRYSYIAAERLTHHGHAIVPMGIKKGEVFGKEILDIKTKPAVADIHTVTLYLGPANQSSYEDFIISLKPKRIIFNPGTENPAFSERAIKEGIEALEACTLVMLSVGNY